jgi:hypothetical protein
VRCVVRCPCTFTRNDDEAKVRCVRPILGMLRDDARTAFGGPEIISGETRTARRSNARSSSGRTPEVIPRLVAPAPTIELKSPVAPLISVDSARSQSSTGEFVHGFSLVAEGVIPCATVSDPEQRSSPTVVSPSSVAISIRFGAPCSVNKVTGIIEGSVAETARPAVGSRCSAFQLMDD